jgi:hypothetical protein
MEQHSKYEFTAEELRQANAYNAVYRDKLSRGLGVGSAMNAAKHAVLHEVANSLENGRTSGGAFRNAKDDIEWGAPQDVARMYDDAYADNEAFDLSNNNSQ